MADENKTVVLGIELDVEGLVAASAEARKNLDELKKKQKELTDAGKAGSIEFEENAAKLRSMAYEYKETNKVIDKAILIRKAEKGSLEALKAELSIARKEFDILSKSQRANSEEGIKLTEKIKALNDEIGNSEKATGNFSRNVWNYASAIDALPGPLKAASEGVSGLKDQFLKLLANPVVLVIAGIVLALKGLHAAFTSTDSGATEFEVKMNQVKGVLGVAKERAFEFGKAVIDLFKGDTESAAKRFGEALGITGESFADAAEQARKYTEALHEISDAEEAYVARSADNRNKIAKLEFAAADKSNSKEARQKALDEAIAIELKETEFKKEQAKKRLDAEAQDLAVKIGFRNADLKSFVKLTEEERKHADKALLDKYDSYKEEFTALTEFYAKAVEADTQYYDTTKKLNAKSTALQDQIDAEAKAKHDEYLKKKEEAEQKAFEKNQKRLKDELAGLQVQVIDSIKLSEGEFNNKVKVLEKQRDIELSQKDVTANQKLLIERNYEAAVVKLGEDTLKAKQDQAKKELDLKLKTITDQSALEKAKAGADILNKKIALDELHSQGLISEQEYQNQLRQLEFEASQTSLQQKADELKQKAELEAEDSANRIALQTEAGNIERQIASNNAQHERDEIAKTTLARKLSGRAALDIAGNLFGELSGLYEQGSQEAKALATAQVTAQTIQAVISAFATAQQSPITTLFPGYPFVQAAAAGVFGALQVAKINDVQFYDGGYTGDGNPRSESTRLGKRPYIYHKREYIVPHQVLETPEGSMMAARLEAMRTKGRSGIRGFYDGGYADRYTSNPVQQNINLSNIENLLSNMPTPVVLVEDINSAQGTKAQVESRANF